MEPVGRAAAVEPWRLGLELESELGAMALVEPSLNICERNSVAFA